MNVATDRAHSSQNQISWCNLGYLSNWQLAIGNRQLQVDYLVFVRSDVDGIVDPVDNVTAVSGK